MRVLRSGCISGIEPSCHGELGPHVRSRQRRLPMFVILLAALCLAQVTTTALAQDVPRFSIASMCHTDAKNDPCVESEGRALAELRKAWSTFPAPARQAC